MTWLDCKPQAGREMNDMHPLTVLSPREFNERTRIVIGLPMTTAALQGVGRLAGLFFQGIAAISCALAARRVFFRATNLSHPD